MVNKGDKKTRIDLVLADIQYFFASGPIIFIKFQHKKKWPIEFISSNVSNWGYQPKDFIQKKYSLSDIIFPQDIEKFTQEMNRFTLPSEKHESFTGKFRILASNENIKWMIHHIFPIRDKKKNPTAYYGYLIDNSDQKKAEEELKLASIVYESSIEGIIITDAKGTIQLVNRAFTTITGYTPMEAIGKNPRILRSNRHDKKFYNELWETVKSTGKWQGEIWNRRKNSETYPQLLSISAIHDEKGNVKHYVGVFNDIIELKQKESEIEYQAYHDPLTGLPNRNLFNDRLKLEIHRSSRNEKKLAVMFLDLDDFKNINDSLGHVIGDFLLQEVAKRLLKCVREVDSVARIGGDEFIVLLPLISDPTEVVIVAQRILEMFKDPFMVQNHELFTTASVGISIYPTDGIDPVDLLKNSDLAMYHAKEQGKNDYIFFSKEMNQQIKTRLKLENQLHKGLKKKQFFLLYQPLVNLTSGEMVGVEALLRWKHPTEGVILPEDFIPLAEETGMILKLGQWVLETSYNQNLQWHQQGYHSIYVSVNISSRQFYRRDFLEIIKKIIQKNQLNNPRLTLQLTENSIMGFGGSIGFQEKNIKILKALKNIGIMLSIDDFGTGYFSFNSLKNLPVDTLKIDRSFVKNIPHQSESVAIVNSIISLAKNLKLKVLAEGVETIEQVNILKKNKCDLIQGFYFSPPVPPEKITQFIKEKKNLYK